METAEKAKSPSFPDGIGHRRTAGDVRARKLYFSSLSAFRSNLLDAADLADSGVRDELLAFLRNVDAIAPNSEKLDAAATQPAGDRPALCGRALAQAAGNGRGMR